MAYTKRTWLGRQGTGLNKFSIGGATPVTIVNQPDSVTQVGDALSAGNLNDLEDRIADAFDDVDTELDTKADEQDVTNLNNAINQLDHRLENIEQSKGDYIVSAYKDGSTTPSGKGKWCVVEGVEGVSRVENQLAPELTSDNYTTGSMNNKSWVDNKFTFTIVGNGSSDCYLYRTFDSVAGHIYLVSFRLSGNATTNEVRVRWPYVSSYEAVSNKTYAFIGTVQAGESVYFGIQFSNTESATLTLDNLIYTDLTVYFAGDPSVNVSSLTIADIQTNYPHLLLPTEYGTRIVDWTGNGVRAYSANMVDSDLLVDPSASVTKSGDVYSCSSAYNLYAYSSDNKVLKGNFKENTQYNISWKATCGSATNIGWHFHYTDGTSSSRLAVVNSTSETYATGYSAANKTIDYIYFNYGGGTTFSFSELMVNEGTTAMPYSPYGAIDTLSFPSISLKSAGSVRDRLELNVEVSGVAKKRETERIVSTALDNKTWIRRNDGLFYTSTPVFSDAKDSSSNVLCDKFLPCPSGQTGTSTPEGCISVGSGGYIYAMKSGIADTTAFLAYVADSVLYSEAKTESVTLSDPIIDNTLLTESGGRMSTVQTGTVVDGIADLGFITL